MRTTHVEWTWARVCVVIRCVHWVHKFSLHERWMASAKSTARASETPDVEWLGRAQRDRDSRKWANKWVYYTSQLKNKQTIYACAAIQLKLHCQNTVLSTVFTCLFRNGIVFVSTFITSISNRLQFAIYQKSPGELINIKHSSAILYKLISIR